MMTHPGTMCYLPVGLCASRSCCQRILEHNDLIFDVIDRLATLMMEEKMVCPSIEQSRLLPVPSPHDAGRVT